MGPKFTRDLEENTSIVCWLFHSFNFVSRYKAISIESCNWIDFISVAYAVLLCYDCFSEKPKLSNVELG